MAVSPNGNLIYVGGMQRGFKENPAASYANVVLKMSGDGNLLRAYTHGNGIYYADIRKILFTKNSEFYYMILTTRFTGK